MNLVTGSLLMPGELRGVPGHLRGRGQGLAELATGEPQPQVEGSCRTEA